MSSMIELLISLIINSSFKEEEQEVKVKEEVVKEEVKEKKVFRHESIIIDGPIVKRKGKNKEDKDNEAIIVTLEAEIERRKKIEQVQATKILDCEDTIKTITEEKDKYLFASIETHSISTAGKGNILTKIEIEKPMYSLYTYKNVPDTLFGMDKNNIPFLIPGLERENRFITNLLEKAGHSSDGVFIIESYGLARAVEMLITNGVTLPNTIKEKDLLNFIESSKPDNNFPKINSYPPEAKVDIYNKLRNNIQNNPDIKEFIREGLLEFSGKKEESIDVFTSFYTGLNREPLFTIVTFVSIEELRRKKSVYVDNVSLAISIDIPAPSFPKPVMHIGGDDISIEYFTTDKDANSKFYALHGNIIELKPILCAVRKEVQIAFKDYISGRSKTLTIEEKDFFNYSIYNTEAEAFLDKGREESLASMLAANEYKELINKEKLTDYNKLTLETDKETRLSELAFLTMKLQSEEKMLEMKRDMASMNLKVSNSSGVSKIVGDMVSLAKLVSKYI